MPAPDPLLAPMEGADHREIGGVTMDTVRAGATRVKRVIYPAGFRWSKNMKPLVGTQFCEHAHVGFLARGHIGIEYTDGCVLDLIAPCVLAIEPGHEGWVEGDEPAVVIEFDFEGDTVSRCGMPASHAH